MITLKQHLSNTCAYAQVTIYLERRVGIQQVVIDAPGISVHVDHIKLRVFQCQFYICLLNKWLVHEVIDLALGILRNVGEKYVLD